MASAITSIAAPIRALLAGSRIVIAGYPRLTSAACRGTKIGATDGHRITELLDAHGKALEQGAPLPKRSYIDQPAFIHTERDPRMHTGPLHTAYLKLSEGCNRRCASVITAMRSGPSGRVRAWR